METISSSHVSKESSRTLRMSKAKKPKLPAMTISQPKPNQKWVLLTKGNSMKRRLLVYTCIVIFTCQSFFFNIPELFICLDVAIRKKCYPRKMQILMLNKHSHWQEIGCARMIYKASNVSIPSRIDTICFSILHAYRIS